MTPADKRMLDQLDRWLVSVELHLKYAELDETSYRQVQPWPEHERPARWILELAQQKLLQLKTLCKAHISNNDDSFAESLELMCFLANLVGAQNIKRFIPLADPAREQSPGSTAESAAAPQPPGAIPKAADDNATREMQQLKPAPARRQQEPEPTREMPRLKVAAKKPVAAPAGAAPRVEAAGKRAHAKSAPVAPAASPRAQEIVVADAVRLLKWGREWHELTELIARMAERPSAGEIRRILRTHKSAIEAQLGN